MRSSDAARALVLVVAVAGASGCGASRGTVRVEAGGERAARVEAGGERAARGPGREEAVSWQSPFDRDHPLVGLILEVSTGRQVDRGLLVDALAGASMVLLGEQHDNPDHHRLRAGLLEELVASGRRPAVVFEMIDMDRQQAVTEAAGTGAADAVASAASWQERWGEFEPYRPLLEAAVRAGLPIVAGGIPRDLVRTLVRDGTSALEPELVARLGLEEPLEPAVLEAMLVELREVHCGLLPEEAVGRMVPAQRARDGFLSDRLVATATADGAVLVAGNGHVRTDRGAGALVRRSSPGSTVVSVGFVEVRAGLDAPAAYARSYGAERLPFDFVWFTPRASDVDRCEELRRHMGGAHGQPGP